MTVLLVFIVIFLNLEISGKSIMSFHKIYQKLQPTPVRFSDVMKVNTGVRMKACVKMQVRPAVCLPVIMIWSVTQKSHVIVQIVIVR